LASLPDDVLSEKRKEDCLVTEHFGHQLPFWQRMVRTDNAKYIYNPVDNDEFYDLENDRWEMKNIIERVDGGKLKQMREVLVAWMTDNKDPLLFWGRPML
jgi:arylsulfatase A-like enzyme